MNLRKTLMIIVLGIVPFFPGCLGIPIWIDPIPILVNVICTTCGG